MSFGWCLTFSRQAFDNLGTAMNSFFQRFLFKIGVAILLVALVDLIYINYRVLLQNQKSSDKVQNENRVIARDPSPIPSPSSNTAKSSPSASPSQASNSPQTIIKEETKIERETVVQTAQKEIFIPIGEGSTKSTSYVDLAGAQVTIDSSKYSGIASVVFEAGVWVTDGNGKMYVQLYNSTAKRPVWFSEISTASSSSTLLTSSGITLDPGSNTYVLQAKTNLEQYPANVKSARVKITLK